MTTQLVSQPPNQIRQTALASLISGQHLLNKSYLATLAQNVPMMLTQSE
ncbi:hypothetical protein HMPREF0027_0957 [Actinobacillus ureae ATCC 25976]|uniref:Uncharacterized protein n=1 Tax=Actinobacillus ureae ATCC 25976 TaxID=887324 RepID=E8KGJ0_9PAST|nr:hypothetical protein [Actinobacillus ureae]EFX91976.1 hypothetical protein HMPREF0027_0957 [Actinobacillus ureae ATCC 25976]